MNERQRKTNITIDIRIYIYRYRQTDRYRYEKNKRDRLNDIISMIFCALTFNKFSFIKVCSCILILILALCIYKYALHCAEGCGQYKYLCSL